MPLEIAPISGNATIAEYALIVDRKSQGTDAGTFSINSFQTRDLNTIDIDDDNIVSSLSSNAFTLNSGTYLIEVLTTLHAGGKSVVRVQNTTDGTTIARSSSGDVENLGINMPITVKSQFRITEQKVFEIQQIVNRNQLNSLGAASNFSGLDEIYTQVHIWKLD